MDRQGAEAKLEATLFGTARGKVCDIRCQIQVSEAHPVARLELRKVLLQHNMSGKLAGSIELTFYWLGLFALPLLIVVVPAPLASADHTHPGVLHRLAE